MTVDFKDFHIGTLIMQRVTECGIEISRICNFLKCSEEEIEKIFLQKDISTDILLKLSKLLGYDFFRVYTQHLILYAPSSSVEEKQQASVTALPKFRKNIYTREVIDFILEMIRTGEKTKFQVIQDYRIPKTTLYKWITKYEK